MVSEISVHGPCADAGRECMFTSWQWEAKRKRQRPVWDPNTPFEHTPPTI
jgi:hypothetical protein